MNTDFETLARRAVACPRWRWMGGMQVVHTPKHDGQTGFYSRLPQDGYVPAAHEFPDLSDPATLGCLLAIVREAHGDPQAHVVNLIYGFRGCWQAWGSETYIAPRCHTEAEALVAALEAAP